MKIDPLSVVLGLLIALGIVINRVRKRIIRRCWVEVVIEDGKKIPLSHFKKGSVKREHIRRCGCLRVKRSCNSILPIGERVIFFARPQGTLRFRARIYDVFKVICCSCPDCKSTICIDVKDHSSISVMHGYWIKLKEQIKYRLGMRYESEFYLGERTRAAITEFGDKLKRGKYAELDADGSLPPTVGNVLDAVFDELK
jgi:hypothetical protein